MLDAPLAVVPPTCQVAALDAYAGEAGIPFADTTAPGPYLWKNVAIKGGGFVTGIVMSPARKGLAFARTDVGGAYRFEPAGRRWMPMTDWAGHDDSNLMGIESIAADPVDPSRVYLAAGEYLTAGNGSILSSTDMGQTWTRNNISASMGGNADGRSMGERLAIDPNLTSTLYFGSRSAGLFRSTDFARTWSQVSTFPKTDTPKTDAGAVTYYGLTFVVFDPRSGSPGSPTPAIYVGVGVTSGTALYRSTDAGVTWEAVAGQPAPGMMPHHMVLDGCGSLYLTYNNGPGPNNITTGAVWRYTMASGAWSPVNVPAGQGGFGGIATDATHPGTLLVATIDRWTAPTAPGEIYRTTNGGVSWAPVMSSAPHDVAGAAWLWWHGTTLPSDGWLGDVEIDPFDPARALYITGQGIWSTYDLTAADRGAAAHWSFEDDGLEETVALDLASPPDGAHLLSGVGDIAGFKHDNLDISPADGMFGNPIASNTTFGNTTSLDFAELNPTIVVRVGTNSKGAQGAYSTDGGTTWTGFAKAPSASTGQGSIAVSADGATFLWAPKSGTPSRSLDNGATWNPSVGISAGVQVAADRVNPAKFYASGRNKVYVSSDGGATFVQNTAAFSGRPRSVFGVEGELWITTSTGLFRSEDSGTTFLPVQNVYGATAVGFGMPAAGQSHPAVYLAGSVTVGGSVDGGSSAGVWGTYRSDDGGVTWQRIDDPLHQFGYINCLTGDPRRYGRVYLGTGGRGLLYGDLR